MELTRIVMVNAKLNSNTLRILSETEDKYKEMLVELVRYAVDKRIKSFSRLKSRSITFYLA